MRNRIRRFTWLTWKFHVTDNKIYIWRKKVQWSIITFKLNLQINNFQLFTDSTKSGNNPNTVVSQTIKTFLSSSKDRIEDSYIHSLGPLPRVNQRHSRQELGSWFCYHPKNDWKSANVSQCFLCLKYSSPLSPPAERLSFTTGSKIISIVKTSLVPLGRTISSHSTFL